MCKVISNEKTVKIIPGWKYRMKCNRMDQQKSNLSFENMDEIDCLDRSMRTECCEERRNKLTSGSVCTGRGVVSVNTSVYSAMLKMWVWFPNSTKGQLCLYGSDVHLKFNTLTAKFEIGPAHNGAKFHGLQH